MTYAEAKQVIENVLRSFVIIGLRGGKVRYQQAVKKAFEAIDKQIPQKVKRRPYLCVHTPGLQFSTHCPRCNALVSEDRCHWIRPFSEPEQYCYKCGQALKFDWR